jgi:hypothetical protein
MDSERITRGLDTGLASEYKMIKIPYINPATKCGAAVLLQGIFNRHDLFLLFLQLLVYFMYMKQEKFSQYNL